MPKAPPISKDLIEYLDKTFPAQIPIASIDAHPHAISAIVHRMNGQQLVVTHLRAVYEEQQYEDPLNVHQSTEDEDA